MLRRLFHKCFAVGTRSVLCGAHCFFLHPWFVAWAWWKLYGFPWDPRLWVAFFVHDLGYIGKPNMDGPEGETHVELGAKIMHWFDGPVTVTDVHPVNNMGELHSLWRQRGKNDRIIGVNRAVSREYAYLIVMARDEQSTYWRDLTMFHSRFYAKKHDRPFSKLCVADKYAMALTPAWMYLPMTRFTGEIDEYMELARKRRAAGEPAFKYSGSKVYKTEDEEWWYNVCSYVRRWVAKHRHGGEDHWTPNSHGEPERGPLSVHAGGEAGRSADSPDQRV